MSNPPPLPPHHQPPPPQQQWAPPQPQQPWAPVKQKSSSKIGWTAADPTLWLAGSGLLLLAFGTFLPWTYRAGFLQLDERVGFTTGPGAITLFAALGGGILTILLAFGSPQYRKHFAAGLTGAAAMALIGLLMTFGIVASDDNEAIAFTIGDSLFSEAQTFVAWGYPISFVGAGILSLAVLIIWVRLLSAPKPKEPERTPFI